MKRAVLTAALLVSTALAVRAQQITPADSLQPPDQSAATPDSLRPAAPIISLFGRVTMDSLRFLSQPEGSISFSGNMKDTLRFSVTNLPDSIEVGRTYRKVQIYFHYSTGVAELDSLLNALQDGGSPR